MATMMKLERSLSPVRSNVYVTNMQDLQYRISGDPINIKKYIALVLDCSEGTGYYKLDGARTRFDVLKENARRLIDRFKNSPETHVCIFAYADKAEEAAGLVRIDGGDNAGNIVQLTNTINALASGENSNMGDGMRKAYWKLKGLPSDGLKCMVLMTSGEPDMFTTVSEHLYHDFNTLKGNIDFMTGDNTAANVYADHSSAVRYGKEMAKFISAENILTFAVGFNTMKSYKLEAVAAACGAAATAGGTHYYPVQGLKDIDAVCDGIFNTVQCDYPFTVSFSEILPAGVKVLTLPEGFTASILNDGRYQVDGEIQMGLNKTDSLGSFAVSPWTAAVGIKYTAEGRKDFSDLQVQYKDRYGNPASAQQVNSLSIDVQVDTVPPVTTCSLSGTINGGQWYSSDIQVTFTATDGIEGTDVAKTEYKIEDGNWQEYTTPFIVGTEGITHVYFRSYDNAGNIEPEKYAQLNIDKSAPVVTYGLIGTKGIMSGWFVSDVQVVLTAADAPIPDNSGVSKAQYRFEGESWQDYTAPFTASSEGTTNLYFRAIDNAGNISSEKSAVIRIDKTGPVLTVPADVTYTASGDSVVLGSIGQASAQDALSGVGAITNNSSMTFPVGPTAVTWTAVDGNGNTNTRVQYVTIQNPLPAGECQYGVIRLNQWDYKIWFTANGFVPSSLRVKSKVSGSEDTIHEMVLNNGVWEYVIKGVTANIDIKYSFTYVKGVTSYSVHETTYKTTPDNAIDSDYTKGVLNLSASDAKIWFKTNQFTAGYVKLYYTIDSSGQQNVFMTNTVADSWELSFSALSNGRVIKYYFLYTNGSGTQYKTPEYTYTHYRT